MLQITITVPTNLEELFQETIITLLGLGYTTSEAEIWAAIYCHSYPKRVEETSEKVIELFGTNLLHTGANIAQLATKFKEYGVQNRVEKLLELSQ